LWAAGVLCGVLASLFAVFLVTWRDSAGCGHLGASANVRAGQLRFVVAALVLAAPWALGMIVAARRWRPMVGGLVITVAPLMIAAATHTHSGDWNGGGFCF